MRVVAGPGDLDHDHVRYAFREREMVSRWDGGVVGTPGEEYRNVAK